MVPYQFTNLTTLRGKAIDIAVKHLYKLGPLGPGKLSWP